MNKSYTFLTIEEFDESAFLVFFLQYTVLYSIIVDIMGDNDTHTAFQYPILLILSGAVIPLKYDTFAMWCIVGKQNDSGAGQTDRVCRVFERGQVTRRHDQLYCMI